jgi:spermidine synthase
VLVVPTLLMGGTLPMLAKEVVVARGAAGRSVGRLYAVNALGGAAGCILAGFVTIGWLGLRGSLLLGVGLNLLAASLAYALARRRPSPEAPASGAAPPAPAPAVRASGGLLAAFFLAGLTGLAAEVVWTRMLLLNIDSTAQSFAAMLAVCLLGLSLGGIATSRTADRADPVRAYGLTLALVGLSILLGMALWATLGTSTAHVARRAVDLLPRPLRGNTAFRLALCLFQCGLLLLLPAFLMGCSFPFAGRFFGRTAPEIGRRLGSAVMLNTLGSMIGPLLCGFWWLPLLGIQKTVVLCGTIAMVAGAGLLVVHTRVAGRWAAAGASSAFLVAAWLLPSDFAVAKTDQRSTGTLLYAEEDVCGSVAVLEIESGRERCRQLKVGTTSMITDAFACRRYTRLLGHVPMLLHPGPRDAMVICLGSGMTLSAVAAHPDVATIDCVELSPGVVRAARRYFSEANGGVLEDPRVRVVVNDGRTKLLVSRKQYDIITLEPPPPYDEGVATLYSREFYELCRARLRPGGMLSQWIPYHCATLEQIRSMLATVLSVFPHATLWEFFDGREYCVVGRLDDSAIPYERIVGRFSEPRVRTHLQAVGIRHPEDVLACFVMGPRGLAAFVGGAPLVTDDLPGLGYDLAAHNLVAPLSWSFQRVIQESSLATAAHAELPTPYLAFANPEAAEAFLSRLGPVKAASRMHALALHLCTLRSSEHPSVFSQRFVAPTALEPDNLYYRYADSRGVYALARAQRSRVHRGADD